VDESISIIANQGIENGRVGRAKASQSSLSEHSQGDARLQAGLQDPCETGCGVQEETGRGAQADGTKVGYGF